MWDTLWEKVLGIATKPILWFWKRFFFILFVTIRVLRRWRKTAWKAFIGGHGYLAILTLIGAYVGAYSLNEARYELRANRAALARSNFITMVSSGNSGAFIAAMQDFGELQNILVPPELSLWEPQSWGWFATPETPNKEPLRRWAQHFLRLCTAKLCGTKKAGTQEEWRILLREANLRNANLGHANLWNANLRNANLGDANLWGANLWGADLGDANLVNADLGDANLRNADLREADLWDANFRNADLRDAKLGDALLNVRQICSALSAYEAVLDSAFEKRVRKQCPRVLAEPIEG